jgi:hypothetical protein
MKDCQLTAGDPTDTDQIDAPEIIALKLFNPPELDWRSHRFFAQAANLVLLN